MYSVSCSPPAPQRVSSFWIFLKLKVYSYDFISIRVGTRSLFLSHTHNIIFISLSLWDRHRNRCVSDPAKRGCLGLLSLSLSCRALSRDRVTNRQQATTSGECVWRSSQVCSLPRPALPSRSTLLATQRGSGKAPRGGVQRADDGFVTKLGPELPRR